MSLFHISVATIDETTGEECLCGDLEFEPFDFAAIAKNPSLGMPQWKRLPLKTEDNLEVFVAFEAGSAKVSLQVRAGRRNVAAVLCDSLQSVKFCSPSGVDIMLTCAEVTT